MEIVLSAFLMWNTPGLSCRCSVSYVRLCNPTNRSTPDFPSFTTSQSLLKPMSIESADDAIQPSHPLSPPFPFLGLSQHQGLFR